MSNLDRNSYSPIKCIQGRYVQLRLMMEADAALIVRWRNHPAVAKWLVQWQPLTVERHLDFLRAARQRGDVLLAILDRKGTPIGTGAIYDFDHHKKVAEWGRLVVDPEGEHSLAAIEASYLAVRYGFERQSLARLHAACSAGNNGAKKLLEFIGFRQEGFRPQHLAVPEGYRDMVEYGLLYNDFKLQMEKIEKLLYRASSAQVSALEGNLE